MLDRITNSEALKYMENHRALTPVAGVIQVAIGILRALGSIFAADSSKKFSAAMAQIRHGLRNIIPFYGYNKNIEEKLAAAITKGNEDTKEAAEAVARNQAIEAAEEALQGVTEGDLKAIAIEAAQKAVEEPAREAAKEAIKELKSEIGEEEAKKAINTAVEAAKAVAAKEAPNAVSAVAEAAAAKKAASPKEKKSPVKNEDNCVIS